MEREQAILFIVTLNAISEGSYTLPTEAQWGRIWDVYDFMLFFESFNLLPIKA